jgi:WD40 repeat protein
MPRFFLLIVLFLPLYTYAQTKKECRSIMEKAETAISAKDYPLALTKLRAYKICDPPKASVADSMIANVFKLITLERDSAVIARNDAVKQTGIARMEKARAEAAQKNAERQAYLAQLSAMSSNVSLLSKEDPTLAFRLACLAYERNPSLENAAILHSIISDTTNGLYAVKTPGYYDSFAYNDKSNTWYGANASGIDENSIHGNRIRRSPGYYDDQTRYVTMSYDARYTVAVLTKELSLYRHADFTEKRISWSGPFIREVRWSGNSAYVQLLDSAGVLHVLDTLLKEVHKRAYNKVSAFDVSPGMDVIAISNAEGILLYDPEEPAPIDTIAERYVNYLAFSPDGRKLYSCTGLEEDKKIKQWEPDELGDLEESDELRPVLFEGHTGKIRSISFSTDPAGESMVLSTSDDGVNILWTEEGKVLRVLKSKVDELRLNSAILSTGGEKAMIRTGNSISLWDLQGNPLGVVSKYYDDKTISDVGTNIIVLAKGNAYNIITPDSVIQVSLSAPDYLYNVQIIDGKGRFLLTGDRSISILNIKTGERKKIFDLQRKYFRASVNADGNILVWSGDTLFHFNPNGVLRHTKKFPFVVQAVCMLPGTEYILYMNDREAYLTDLSTGRQKGKWNTGDLRSIGVIGMAVSPFRDYIIVWTNNKAILLDSVWRHLKTYNYRYMVRAKFSEDGDSLYFFGMGVETRYTLQGLKRTEDIYDLTIEDKLRYNVPGIVKDIVNKRDWTEYEACISYFTTDYYTSHNEVNIEQLNYLESQSHRFFQKSRYYYSMLDGRITYIKSFASFARGYDYEALEKVLQKIVANLTKEKKILSALYDKK